MSDLNTTIGRATEHLARSGQSMLDRRMRAALRALRPADAARRHRAAMVPHGRCEHAARRCGATPGSTAIDSAQRSVLFWDTLRQRGNNWIAHEEAGKPPLLALRVRDARRRRDDRAAGQLRAGADHSARGRRRRRHAAPVHHHRSARRPRPGHRRLQGGFRGRRRTAGGPPGVFRHLLSGSRAGADARGRHRRRGGVRPHRRERHPRQPEAGARRQLPGRLGGDDAGGLATRHRGAAA